MASTCDLDKNTASLHQSSYAVTYLLFFTKERQIILYLGN